MCRQAAAWVELTVSLWYFDIDKTEGEGHFDEVTEKVFNRRQRTETGGTFTKVSL